jgi:uncharacterized protein (TIGR03437 family)
LAALGQDTGVTACPYFVRTVPVALLNDGSSSVRLEVLAGSQATSVTWRPLRGSPFMIGGQSICTGGAPSPSFSLRDDGQGGDLKASDGVFTLDNISWDPTPACQIVGSLIETTGAMMGWGEYNYGTIAIQTASGETDLNLANGYYNTLVVVEAQMYRVLDAVTPIDANTQQTAWLVNVRDDNLQVERAMNNLAPALPSLGGSISSLSHALTDGYDFRTLMSTTTTACDQGRTQGIHIVVQSNVTGNGERISNVSQVYQTGPKALGISLMANFKQGSSSGLYYHETMHQWGAYLSTQLNIDDAGAHWLENSSVGGALGGCPWKDNGDGTFSTDDRQPVDGDFELYVSGLLPASQVRPAYVAAANIQNCNPGQLLKAPYRQVTVDDIIRVHGPRVPAYDGNVKTYKHGIIVTSQNRLLTPFEMTYYGRIAQMWEGSTIELGAVPPLQWPVFTRGASAFNMLLDSWKGPVARASNIVNAASLQAGALSPGEVILLSGAGLGPDDATGATITDAGNLDTQSGGTQVLFGGLAAPMLSSSAGQVGAIVPYEVAGHIAVSVQVQYQGQLSPVVSLPVAPSAPGIFTEDGRGQGPGQILNEDSSLNTADNPAAADSMIQISGTGQGQSIPGGVDGVITQGMPSTEQPPAVTIGGLPAAIVSAGPAPGQVAGYFQVIAIVPEGLPSGPVPVVVQFGAASSQPGVTMFVQ